MKKLKEVRQTFLDYFKLKSHTVIPSSSLIPHNDPSLLFTNAGMVQFKNIFTGNEHQEYKRVVTSQKCLRAGGKHNDLDNVGYTARHHTFFEMLGNFSFGDYFKEEAIAFAWELITKYFCISPERLLVTVFSEDDESAKIWKKVSGFHDSKIIKIATQDNFWSMGNKGPCGPCSEIFYDHGCHIEGGPPGSKNEDGDRFVEIYNLVFMKFEKLENGKQINLPKPSIDTGMGLERMASVMQGVHNNFEIDIFKSIIACSQELTKNSNSHQIQSHNIIADHLRACAFLIADGITPSNEGRGYVLRRIMRRAMRHIHLLVAKEPLMWRMVPVLTNLMGEYYPELIRAQSVIEETLKSEEEKFKYTLSKGLKLLNEESKKLSEQSALPGEVAFRLYDTYGFPLDLTQDILRSENYTVDVKGFDQAMQKQRNLAKKSWSGSKEEAYNKIWFWLNQKSPVEFLGYSLSEAEACVTALVDYENNMINTASSGENVFIVTNQTPFYAESGGQVGDSGVIISNNGCKIRVDHCVKKLNSLNVHECFIEFGSIAVGDFVKLKINKQKRKQIEANHSATHLLHAALRTYLGKHVLQKGSLVTHDRLRFDFTHNSSLSSNDIAQIEAIVNHHIISNHSSRIRYMPIDEARSRGAMALFGEKYGDEVRVVSMGDFSTELCGGTHVHLTGSIGLFKVIHESSVSSGIRRIEAMTGYAIINRMNDLERMLKIEQENFKKQLKSINKENENLKRSQTLKTLQKNYINMQCGSYNVLIQNLQDIPPGDLKNIADQMKKDVGSGIVVVSSVKDEKISLVVGVTNNLTQKLSAVNLIEALSQFLGGKGGGGRADMAQSGGVFIEKIKEIDQFLLEFLK